jgi:hypothetical protein
VAITITHETRFSTMAHIKVPARLGPSESLTLLIAVAVAADLEERDWVNHSPGFAGLNPGYRDWLPRHPLETDELLKIPSVGAFQNLCVATWGQPPGF